MDTNNDGIIDYQEFIMACSSYENIVNEKNVRELFESIDLNGDGQIQMGELQAMFQEEQLSATGVGTGATAGNDEKAIWIQIMEEMDSTGSRTISYPEFQDSLFMVLQRNLDEVSPVLKSSYRASICIDGS
jgi:Ca2+-binding EF-hand superfamily protein